MRYSEASQAENRKSITFLPTKKGIFNQPSLEWITLSWSYHSKIALPAKNRIKKNIVPTGIKLAKASPMRLMGLPVAEFGFLG